jgi:hypothetical protein
LSFGTGSFRGTRVPASARARVARITGEPANEVAAATEPKKLLRERVFIMNSTRYIEIVDFSWVVAPYQLMGDGAP